MTACLIEHFSTLEDPRIDRNKCHELIDIIVLAVKCNGQWRRWLGSHRRLWKNQTGVVAPVRSAQKRCSLSRLYRVCLDPPVTGEVS